MEVTKVRVGPADRGRTMSLEDFAEAEGAPGYRYELARGVIEVVEIPGYRHGQILHNFDLQVFPWEATHSGIVHYHASGDRCAIRLPGMKSERHPDVALYLSPSPDPVSPWERWIPDIVVEVVSEGGEHRDYEEKRQEYLLAGVREYWIIDPAKRAVLILQRIGDTFREMRPATEYATPLLPGFTLDVTRLFAS